MSRARETSGRLTPSVASHWDIKMKKNNEEEKTLLIIDTLLFLICCLLVAWLVVTFSDFETVRAIAHEPQWLDKPVGSGVSTYDN